MKTSTRTYPPLGGLRHAATTWLALLAGLFYLLVGSSSVVAHPSPVGCTGSALGIDLFTSSPDVHIGDTVKYSVTIFNGLPGSPRVACDAEAIQAALVTPDGVSHDLTPLLVRRTLLSGQNDFYQDVASYVVRAQDIRPDGTVRATATDTGVIHQNDTDSQGGGNQGVNTEVSLPCINLTVQCLGSIGQNGLITFSGTVTNCGNNTLVGVTITNSNDNGSFKVVFTNNLLRGEGAAFNGSFLPLNPCTADTVVLVATGVDQFTSFPKTVTSTAQATCATVLTPGIKVTKACPVAPVAPGQLLTYTGTVKNTGNVTLTNIVVVDDQPAPNTAVFTLASLAPGEVANFSGSYPAPVNCSIADTLTARAASICGVAVTSSASATCLIVTSPAIEVTQICPVALVAPGGVLSYTGTVRNTGEGTLTNIVVSNDRSGPAPIFTIATLAPGASASFSGSYVTLTNCCVDSSKVTARGQSLCAGTTVSATATRTCALLTSPKITVTKLCTPGILRAGDLLTYRGTVSNAGTITLTDVAVVNDRPGSPPLLGRLTLAPGETATYFATYVIPVDFCGTDTVTATGLDVCTKTPVTAKVTSTCVVTTEPAISIVKNCPAEPTPLGGLHIYTGTVKNTGKVTLLDVFVVDNQPTNNTPILGPITLAPGASVGFTGSYVVPADCCETTDTLTARGADRCTGVSVKATATQVCPLLTTPALTVAQVCPATPISVGSLFRFSGSVTNTGDITLTNVYVFGPRPGDTNSVLGPIELAPGESETFSGSYLVPFDSCSVTITGTGHSVCTGVIITNVASCPVATSPAIAVTQICPVNPVIPGSPLTYRGTVRNSGDITLTNVVVANDRSGATPVFTAALLAPGAVANFTGSYLAPADCSGTSTVTARAVSLCGEPVMGMATAACPVLTAPAIAVTKVCPTGSILPGGRLVFTGTVVNTGDVTLMDVFVVDDQPAPNTPVLGPITLAPGASTNFTGSYLVAAITNLSTNMAQVVTTNLVSVVTTNTVKIITTNTVPVVTTNTVPVITTNSVPVYTTNTVPVVTTNTTVTVTTNVVAPVFATINPVSKATVDRFSVPDGLEGLTYADQDEGYAATQFYAMRKDGSGTSFFATLTAGTGAVVDRFAASNRAFDSLGFAAPDVGYGPVIFYYLSHDSSGVSTFGDIHPGGAVGVVADHFVVGNGFDSLTFSATDVGYGANLFYYVRHDALGVSTFGTINPALPGKTTDRFTVGNNVDAMVFTATEVGAGYGPNHFYYLRHNSAGISTFGTIFVTGLTTATVTDRFAVGPNAHELTFTPTDTGFGPNLFYFLRNGVTRSTNAVVTYTTNSVAVVTTNSVPVYTTNSLPVITTNSVPIYTTNSVPVFTTNSIPVFTTNTFTTIRTNIVAGPMTDTVTASGTDICGSRTVTARASCTAGSGQPPVPPVIGGPGVPPPSQSNGVFGFSFATQAGVSYTVQYKDSLSEPTWTDMPDMPVTGTGGILTVTDPTEGRPTWFYRVILRP